jgi:hypothetical protein
MTRLFSSFFSSHPHTDESDTGRVYETLKSVCSLNDLILLEDATVFSRRESTQIPLLLFDPFRGFYVFDAKSWDYPYLKDAKVKAAVQSTSMQNNIRVDAHQALITQKLNEVLHHDGCAVTNFAILERLTEEEFDSLDDSFTALLPKDRVFFADESPQSMLQKLHSVAHYYETPLEPAPLLGSLFVQFGILPDERHPRMRFASEDQRHFITHVPEAPVSQLVGTYGSGKSSALLLKAVYEKLTAPQQRIVLLEPTVSACETQKERLLQLNKHALMTLDDTAIEIMTPSELIALHYEKLYKKKPPEMAEIDMKMMKSRFDIADLILCDDALLLDGITLSYLKHVQEKSRLILAAVHPVDETYPTHTLPGSFRCKDTLLSLIESADEAPAGTPDEESFRCISGNAYLHSLVRLGELLKTKKPEEILILTADGEMAVSMRDEINGYFGETAQLLPTSAPHHQKTKATKMQITEIENASGLENSAVILCGICDTRPELLRYALGRAAESVSIILDDRCDSAPPYLQQLKESICQK